MKSQDKENTHRANILLLVLAVAMLVATVTGTTAAKSLYVIADLNATPSPIQAYDVAADGTLQWQKDHPAPRYGWGPMGLAIDSDAGYLFVTYENTDVIQLLDARRMTDAGTVTPEGAVNLAGIVYDHGKGLLYCADRGTDKLYVYEWDASTATLTPVLGSPVTLPGATAFGIALDEFNDLLYVGNYSNSILVYNTSTWCLTRTISVSRPAIGVAIHAADDLLYYGGGYAEDPNNFFLTQYDLATDTEAEVQVGSLGGVMGLAVDEATGLVYVTTGRNNMASAKAIQVYNQSLREIQYVGIGTSLAGLVIPPAEVSYNPLNLRKNTAGWIEQVKVGDTVSYDICFDNNDNAFTINNVTVVDTLPDEVNFVSPDGDGVFGYYDPAKHTYTWTYPSMEPGSGDCLELVVQVNSAAKPGMNLTNFVTIDSDETPRTTTSYDVYTVGRLPLNISKTIVGDPESVLIGGTFTYDICFDNNDNYAPVTDVSIVDALPDEVNFVRAKGHGESGYYNGVNHSYIWSYPSLAAGSGDCLSLVVRVNPDTEPNTIISDFVTIDSNETGPTTASIDVPAKQIAYKPLNLSKDIVRDPGDDGECVGVGSTVTYEVCFANNDNDFLVTGVSIVDTLPDELSFVTADGDSISGQYDPNTHTYTWFYESLSPGSGACLELVTQINQDTEPNTIITNSVTITSNETPPSPASIDFVTCGEDEPLEAELRIVKVSVVPRRRLKDIMVIVKLPQGVGTSDIKDELLVLGPGGTEARYQHVYASGNRAKVIALFDGAGLLDAVPGYGPVNVTVTGRLKTGRPFYGKGTIVLSRLLGPRLR